MRKRRARLGVPVLLVAGVFAIAGCANDPAAGTDSAAQPAAEKQQTAGDADAFCTLLEERGDELAQMGSGAAEGDSGELDAAREAMKEIAAAAPSEIKPAMDTIVDAFVDPDGSGLGDEEAMTKVTTAVDQVSGWITEHCDADIDLGVGGISGE